MLGGGWLVECLTRDSELNLLLVLSADTDVASRTRCVTENPFCPARRPAARAGQRVWH